MRTPSKRTPFMEAPKLALGPFSQVDPPRSGGPASHAAVSNDSAMPHDVSGMHGGMRLSLYMYMHTCVCIASIYT